jgi:hypothetical protein
MPALNDDGDEARTRGRPSRFSKTVADHICAKLAEGLTLREVCREDGTPSESTVRTWVLEDRDGFYAQYARAREIGYHTMADELIEISDNGKNDWMLRNGKDEPGYEANGEHLQRSRLRVDTRKWMLSKALPKIYGDKTQVEANVTVRHEDALDSLDD